MFAAALDSSRDLLALGATVAASCGGTTAFDPTVSSPSYSTLAGVVAGVVFTGIVLLIGSRDPAHGESDRRAALEVLTPTFFVMLICSFLFAEVSGETICSKANALALSAGTLLAVGSAAAFQAVAWMLRSHDADNTRVGDVAATTRFFIVVIAAAQLALTATDVQAQYGRNHAVLASIWLFLGLIVVLTMLIAFRWWRGYRLPAVQAWWSTPALLMFLGLTLTFYDIQANGSKETWSAPQPPRVLFLAALGGLVGFTICSIVLLLGAPGRRARG